MRVSEQKKFRTLSVFRSVLLGAAGGFAIVLGLVSLVGWARGDTGVVMFGTGSVPIAPITCVLFLLMGVAVALQSPAAPSPRLNAIAVGLAVIAALIALVSLGAWWVDAEAQWEHFGFVPIDVADVPRVGHILPATAIFFTLMGLVFVLTHVSRFVNRWTVAAALGGAFLLWATSVVFLFRYLMEGQPLVPTARVTPAFSTVLGMAPLGVALMVLVSRFGTEQRAGADTPRYLFWVFSFLGTVIVSAGSIYYNRYEAQFRADTEERVVGILSAKARRLAEWRAERLNDGEFYFENPVIGARVRRISTDAEDDKARGFMHAWLTKSGMTVNYDQFRLVNPDGETLLSHPEKLPPATIDTRRAAAAAIQAGRPLLQDIYWHERDGRPCMAVAVPISEEANEPWLGVILFRIDPSRRLFPFVKEWPLPEEGVDLLLIRQDGEDVTILNKAPQPRGAASGPRIPMKNTNSALVRAMAGPAGVYFGAGSRGEPVLAAARPVKDSPWTLVAVLNPELLGAPLRERVWAVLLLVGVVLFGIAAALSMIWRHQRARFLREQLKVAEALRASEGRFRRVLETVSLVGVVLDVQGRIVLANDYLQRMSGWSADDLLGKSWFEIFLPPETRATIESGIFLKSIQDGLIPAHYENEIMTRAGGRRLVAWNNTVLRDAFGNVTGVASIGEDITERRRAEIALAQSRERFELAVAGSRDGIWDWNVLTGEDFFSDRWCELLGYSREELDPKYSVWERLLHPEDRPRVLEHVRRHLERREPFDVEYRMCTKSGEYRWYHARGQAHWDDHGRATRMSGSLSDISERKRAEEELVASLREKEALLKEVHHRVKNNLQVVASLLRLESGRSEHMLTKFVLQEMHGRIRAMALLHESLYRNAKFDRIDLAAYLRQLVAYLGRSLGPAAGALQFDLQLEPVEVAADEAIPCGLITNELVTNSVKHGFPDGAKGVVAIALQRVGANGAVELRVSDDGVGLPAGFDPANTKSLGMQLVTDLARQLGGQLTVGPGTRFTVSFSVGPAGSIPLTATANHTHHG